MKAQLRMEEYWPVYTLVVEGDEFFYAEDTIEISESLARRYKRNHESFDEIQSELAKLYEEREDVPGR